MIRSLTSFRFVTAFVVFLFHCNIHFKWQLGVKLLDKFINHGATFMTGFFVLSGFIMAHVYRETDFTNRTHIGHYYLKRFAKIYPTYILATVTYFVVFPETTTDMVRVVTNDLFLVQAFFPSMFRLGLNGGTWSLTVEMFLYFLFPFLMLITAKSPKTLWVAFGFTALISLNVYLAPTDYTYANPVMRLGDFLCGMGFYFIKDKFKDLRFAGLLHVSVIALLFGACHNFGSKGYNYMLGQGLIAPLFGLWITLLYYSKNRIFDNPVMNYLGLISYSFYLWQFVMVKLGKGILIHDPAFNTHLLVIGGLALNLTLSALSYHLWEEKWRKVIVRRFAVTSAPVS